MNKSVTGTINATADNAPSKLRRGTLISPRAEAFKTGQRERPKDAPGDPFDPRKYREIYSETD